MGELLRLPHEGRTSDYFAEFTLFDEGDHLVARNGWIQAEGRGRELMDEIQKEFRSIAGKRGKKLVHQYEAKTLAGKKFIHHYLQYQWVGRSTTRNPLYEYSYDP